MNDGLITNVLSWGTHPTYSEGTAIEWFWGAVLIFIIAFLWSRVVSEIK